MATTATRAGEHAVVVAGGGPTGLMLAGELALAGVDVVIVERRATQDLDGSRAGGLHARTIEVLDQRGIAERFIDAGQIVQTQGYALIPLDISDFPTRFNHGLALSQVHIERLLADWVAELGVPILREREVTGCTQHADHVDVELSGDEVLRARHLVGCDGGRSIVRKAAGIEFPGWDPTTTWLIAEVEMASEPELGMRRDAAGTHGISRMPPAGPLRVLVMQRRTDHVGEPDMDELRAALVGVYGTDFGVHSPTWISRFTDATRQAATYRHDRVLLAGDAAHVHPPHGGQGLNLGVQDAVNLGWKLGQVVRGESPAALLDTYHAERHPVAARVLRRTMAQVALGQPDERHDALREEMATLLAMDEPRRCFAGMLSGLDIHYDLGAGHPLLGRRMPDRDLQTTAGSRRVFELLHDARPVLVDLGAGIADADLAAWSDRVRLVRATSEGPWELPVLGAVVAPGAALVRPDGYVAWTGAAGEPALTDVLTAWCGPPP